MLHENMTWRQGGSCQSPPFLSVTDLKFCGDGEVHKSDSVKWASCSALPEHGATHCRNRHIRSEHTECRTQTQLTHLKIDRTKQKKESGLDDLP